MSALEEGMTIKIKGLKNNNWRNGRVGIIQGEYTDKKGIVRWKVKIIGKDGKSENYLGLKPENIEIIRGGDEAWNWLEPDEGERAETPVSAPQSPKNTGEEDQKTNKKGGRTRKKIRKRKKRKSRRKKRKRKKNTRKKRGGGKCASKPAVEEFDLDEAIENMKGNRKRLQEIIDKSTINGKLNMQIFLNNLQKENQSQGGGKHKKKTRKKRTVRRKKKIKNKKKYYIKNPKTPPKKIKCCVGPGCSERLHCINVIGDGSKKYPFVYKKW